MKQINDTLVVGTIIVPRQECFVLEKDKRKRKNVKEKMTQVFPFLLPLRKWQRKKYFYFKMKFDGNRYAKRHLRNCYQTQYLKHHHLC